MSSRRLLGSVAILLAAACGSTDPEASKTTTTGSTTGTGGTAPEKKPLPPLPLGAPDALGPYRIGVTTLETTDGEPGGRTLPVEVWYPALPGSAEIAHYKITIGTIDLVDLASPLGALRDAPADLRGAPHPTVIFSHGFDGIRFQSVYMTEYLASHGFVVAAPDHTGNTIHEGIDASLALPTAEMARLRPIDVSRTLDLVLARAADHEDPLGWMADPSRVGTAGHSFGAFTTMRIAGGTIDVAAVIAYCKDNPGGLFCQGWEDVKDFPSSARDERFIAALPQATAGGAAFGPIGYGAITIPTMLQAGTTDETAPVDTEAKPAFDEISGPGTLLAIDKAGHFTFSDMCLLIEVLGLGGDQFADGCSTTNLDPDVAHAIINRYATAFLQVNVAGEKSFASFLAKPATLPPNVAIYDVK